MIVECVTAAYSSLTQDPDNLSPSLGFNMRYYPSVPCGFILDQLFLSRALFISSLFPSLSSPPHFHSGLGPTELGFLLDSRGASDARYAFGKARLVGLSVTPFSRSGSPCGTEGGYPCTRHPAFPDRLPTTQVATALAPRDMTLDKRIRARGSGS